MSKMITSPNLVVTTQDRIIFVPEMVAFGGGERVYLSLSKFLHQQGIPHRITSFYQDIRLQDYADWPVEIELLRPSRNPFSKARSLKQYFVRQQEAGSGRPLLIGVQAALYAGVSNLDEFALLVLDAPSLVGQDLPPPSPRSRVTGWLRRMISDRLTKWSIHHASPLIIPTDVMADEIEGLYGRRPLISRFGVAGEKSQFRYRPLMSGKPLRLLSVCRLEKNKRIDWMLRSLAALEASEPPLRARTDWRLDVVGKGAQEDELRALAETLGLSNHVVFHGLVSDERLEEVYGEADVFLMPAVQGYGLPALEALTRKVPVVMHAQSGVSEILNGTPWVEIIRGGEESLTAGMGTMISRLLDGGPSEQTLPNFPTESQWAEEVCRLCGWL